MIWGVFRPGRASSTSIQGIMHPYRHPILLFNSRQTPTPTTEMGFSYRGYCNEVNVICCLPAIRLATPALWDSYKKHFGRFPSIWLWQGAIRSDLIRFVVDFLQMSTNWFGHKHPKLHFKSEASSHPPLSCYLIDSWSIPSDGFGMLSNHASSSCFARSTKPKIVRIMILPLWVLDSTRFHFANSS